MFKHYGKDCVTEVGGTMRIIGDANGRLCLLKDKDGPLYVGSFCDCEYVAAFLKEVEMNRIVELHFNRFFMPCSPQDAVRSVVSTLFDTSYRINILYESSPNWCSSAAYCLREILKSWSPYSISKYTKDGTFTVDQYVKMIVHDQRDGRAACISFTRGIKLLSNTTLADAHKAVGGITSKLDCTYPGTFTPTARWCWDLHGECPEQFLYAYDPDRLLSSEKLPFKNAEYAAYVKETIISKYTKCGRADMIPKVEEYFSK